MDISAARINGTVEAADDNWMLDFCPTYHRRVTHGLVIDIDERYSDTIVVRWIGPNGLQDIAYQLPPHSLVPSRRPAPPLTVELRRRLVAGDITRDEPMGFRYYTTREALFWLNSGFKTLKNLGAVRAPDTDSPIPGAFSITTQYADYTEIQYAAPIPATRPRGNP